LPGGVGRQRRLSTSSLMQHKSSSWGRDGPLNRHTGREQRVAAPGPCPNHLLAIQTLQVRQSGHHKGPVAWPAGAGVAQQVQLLQLLILLKAAGRTAG
jgi:hypothetical protein